MRAGHLCLAGCPWNMVLIDAQAEGGSVTDDLFGGQLADARGAAGLGPRPHGSRTGVASAGTGFRTPQATHPGGGCTVPFLAGQAGLKIANAII